MFLARSVRPALVAAISMLALSACEEEFVPDVAGDCACDDVSADVADAGTADASDAAGADTESDGSTEDYPAGPYGTEVDDTAADASFTDHEGNEISLGSIYRDPAARLLLVSTSAEWCSACREEQPLLQALYDEYRDDGFRTLVTIFENANFQDANTQDVLEWRELYDLSFYTVLDVGNSFSDYYDVSLTPMNMLVSVDPNGANPMQILYIEVGALNEDAARRVIELSLGL